MPYVIISTQIRLETGPTIVGDEASDSELMGYLGASLVKKFGNNHMEYSCEDPPRLVMNKLEKRGYTMVASCGIGQTCIWTFHKSEGEDQSIQGVKSVVGPLDRFVIRYSTDEEEIPSLLETFPLPKPPEIRPVGHPFKIELDELDDQEPTTNQMCLETVSHCNRRDFYECAYQQPTKPMCLETISHSVRRDFSESYNHQQPIIQTCLETVSHPVGKAFGESGDQYFTKQTYLETVSQPVRGELNGSEDRQPTKQTCLEMVSHRDFSESDNNQQPINQISLETVSHSVGRDFNESKDQQQTKQTCLETVSHSAERELDDSVDQQPTKRTCLEIDDDYEPTPKKRRTYKKANLKKKKAVVDYARLHGVRLTARHFKMSKSTVSDWCRTNFDDGGPRNEHGHLPRQGRPLTYSADIEQKLLTSVLKQREQQKTICVDDLCKLARREITPTNKKFKASRHWADRFLARHKLVLKAKSSDSPKS